MGPRADCDKQCDTRTQYGRLLQPTRVILVRSAAWALEQIVTSSEISTSFSNDTSSPRRRGVREVQSMLHVQRPLLPRDET
jgi:hypothetical protein